MIYSIIIFISGAGAGIFGWLAAWALLHRRRLRHELRTAREFTHDHRAFGAAERNAP